MDENAKQEKRNEFKKILSLSKFFSNRLKFLKTLDQNIEITLTDEFLENLMDALEFDKKSMNDDIRAIFDLFKERGQLDEVLSRITDPAIKEIVMDYLRLQEGGAILNKRGDYFEIKDSGYGVQVDKIITNVSKRVLLDIIFQLEPDAPKTLKNKSKKEVVKYLFTYFASPTHPEKLGTVMDSRPNILKNIYRMTHVSRPQPKARPPPNKEVMDKKKEMETKVVRDKAQNQLSTIGDKAVGQMLIKERGLTDNFLHDYFYIRMLVDNVKYMIDNSELSISNKRQNLFDKLDNALTRMSKLVPNELNEEDYLQVDYIPYEDIGVKYSSDNTTWYSTADEDIKNLTNIANELADKFEVKKKKRPPPVKIGKKSAITKTMVDLVNQRLKN